MEDTHTLKTSALLKNKSLALLIATRSTASFAYQMFTICIAWDMYSITHSAFYLGLVGLIQFLPTLFLSLFVGQLADRYDRRKIVKFSQTLQSILILSLAFISFQGWLSKESLLLLIFLEAVVHSFEGPSMQALLPNVVERDVFPRASALNASAFQASTIIGPCVGGFLYAFSPKLVYLIVGILILISSILITGIQVRKEERVIEPVTVKSLFTGLDFIRSKPIILGAISLDLFAVLFGGATALLPIYASQILMIGTFGLGVLRSAPAVGALIMSAFLAKRPLKNKVGRTMFVSVICFGIATIVFAISKWVVVSFLALVMLGAFDVISVVIRSTLVQLQTPDSMRGRVSAVNMIFIGASNQLGEFESGVTAGLLGTVPAAIIGGIGTITVVLLWRKLFPSLYHVNQLK